MQPLSHPVMLVSAALASTGRSSEDRQRLLEIIIVGGGPTGVEVAGELKDFIEVSESLVTHCCCKAPTSILLSIRQEESAAHFH